MPRLSYEELLDILEQLPVSEGDVFSMITDDERPKEEFAYVQHVDPPRANTVIVPLDKRKYRNIHDARKRAAELFLLRGLKPYKAYQTVRYFCWYTVKV